jgi:hypothetical protein
MRIRTDGDKAFREDEIHRAAEFYDRNKTDSVVRACRDLPELADAVEEVLDRDDLTQEQRREIAATLSTRYINFEVSAGTERTIE